VMAKTITLILFSQDLHSTWFSDLLPGYVQFT
jgi:hypothetical protein